MGSFLRNILPISSSKIDNGDDEYNVEYSFAMEYAGPPVPYEIPRATPVDVVRIPTASVVASASMLSNPSLPVIQPIVKSGYPLIKNLSNDSKLVSPQNSGKFDGSAALGSGLSHDDQNLPQLPDENGSSDTLGFSDSHDDELSGSTDVEGLRDDCAGNNDLGSSELQESGSSSDSMYEAPRQDHRTQVVTFRESAIVHQESDHDEPEIIEDSQTVSSRVKKGSCYRCFKGNRFTEKEICSVCNAKYCSKCVLRAMGSMPEGRKCITCIGSPINELKRGSLGRCSRMLRRLLSDWEVKQRMHLEVSCQANQLPSWLVIVNGNSLSVEELVQLQSCAHPPKRLKPGKYWYDKVSGFWGKEGHKPCQIISPQLSVGGHIMTDASNGNTHIQINNREITKAELLMLQLARINCEGYPHFWLSHDGSYQEEGQNQVRGKIWEKTGIKQICAFLSLPLPPESAISSAKEADNINSEVGQNNFDKKSLTKLLLVGHDQSGTSTIFKQARILYNVPFSEDERQNVKVMIQSSMYRYLAILLDGRKRFEEERAIQIRRKLIEQPGTSVAGNSNQIGEKNIYSISPRLQAFSNWLLEVMKSGNLEAIFPASTREYSPLVEELWKSKAFQSTYTRKNELEMLPSAASFFLHRAVEISRTDYDPSDLDILYADGITSSNGLSCMEFTFPKSVQDSLLDPSEKNDPLQRCQLIRVHSSSLGENCKWLEMFEDVDLVLYCVDLTSYDQFFEDSNGVPRNKMLESRSLFETIVTHPTFVNKDFLLMLNKSDLFEQKIDHAPLTQCSWFHDYNPVISHHKNHMPSQCAFHYIADKFKRLFDSVNGRKLYVSAVTGLEGDSVDEALKYGREILKWVDEEQKPIFSLSEWSSESIETSS